MDDDCHACNNHANKAILTHCCTRSFSMGFLSDLFKKPEPPRPYEWAFLKQQCLQAMENHRASSLTEFSLIEELDYDRLEASGEDAEDVVAEIWAALKNVKTPEFSPSQKREYLVCAAEILQTEISPKEAAAQLTAVEARLRQK